MTSVGQMIPSQSGIIPQFSGEIPHTTFWEAIVYVDNYSYCYYAYLMRVTSAE